MWQTQAEGEGKLWDITGGGRIRKIDIAVRKLYSETEKEWQRQRLIKDKYEYCVLKTDEPKRRSDSENDKERYNKTLNEVQMVYGWYTYG